MKSSWWFRFSFSLFVVLVSVFMIIPTVFNFPKDSSFPVKSKINLGLDLQGGLYMILGIDFVKVYRDEIKNYMRKIEQLMKDEDVTLTLGKIIEAEELDPRYTLNIEKAENLDKVKNKVKEYFPGMLRLTGESGKELEYALGQTFKKQIEEQALSKSIEVIRNRIDEFGVTEPEITSQGNDRIVIQLPGVKDIDRAKNLIGKTAKLEFKIVNDDISEPTLLQWLDKAKAKGIMYEKGERFSDYLHKLNEFLKADLPKDFEMAFRRPEGRHEAGQEGRLPILVETIPSVTGDDLEDANVQIDQQKNQPYVSMTFNTVGAKKFDETTAKNVGKRLAVILDGNVYTAPVIQQRISGGHAQITLGYGNFNEMIKQAKDIALVLRAGALPVQLDFEEQRVVGPSLGQDSIESAKMATIIGCVLVFIALLLYYKLSGIMAVTTLLVNMLIIMACLVGLDATLTLPGIAGIALTVGMAVDGNIIVYERIREEIRKGIGHFKAVEAGFEHAFWTIVDANVTTAMAGLCLLNFGTGPVRGFAVTLLIGIMATVYTSYFLNRIMFEFYLHSVEGKELSI